MPYGLEETNSVGSSAPVRKAPEGPGAELDRILGERQSARRELQRLQETAKKLDAKARELAEVLTAQVHDQENTPKVRGDY